MSNKLKKEPENNNVKEERNMAEQKQKNNEVQAVEKDNIFVRTKQKIVAFGERNPDVANGIKTIGKVLVVGGAAVGGFFLGRATSGNDDEDEPDYYDLVGEAYDVSDPEENSEDQTEE